MISLRQPVSFILCFSFFLGGWSTVDGVRVKVSLLPVNQHDIQTERQGSSSRTSACSDNMIVNKEMLYLPSKHKIPWESEIVNVYHSRIAINGMNNFFSRDIPGLNGTTIKEMLDYFNASGCLCFPFGGSVRDQFLGVVPNDLDMEISCTADEFIELCQAKWPSDQCKRSLSSPILHVGTASDPGDEEVDARNWDEVFFDGVKELEYTTNSLAYDSNFNNVVVDLTGTGVVDTCDKKIRIPGTANESNWNDWYSSTKGYRYWKLRAKGYTPFDEETLAFIVTNVGGEIRSDSSSFLKYYCRSILGGIYTAADECFYSDCAKHQVYEDMLQEDLASYWNAEIFSGFTCDTGNSFATPSSYSSFQLIAIGLLSVLLMFVHHY